MSFYFLFCRINRRFGKWSNQIFDYQGILLYNYRRNVKIVDETCTNHWNNTLESRICLRRSKSSFTSRQAWPRVSAMAAYTSALGLWFEINWSACRSNSSTGLCLLLYRKFEKRITSHCLAKLFDRIIRIRIARILQ